MSFIPQPRARVHFHGDIAQPQPLIPTPYRPSIVTNGRIDSLGAPSSMAPPPPLVPEGEYFVPNTSDGRGRLDNASAAEADALRRRVQQLEIEAHRARESAALAIRQVEFEREPSWKVREAETGSAADENVPNPAPRLLPRVILHVHERFKIAANKFGLSREYRRKPSAIPDVEVGGQLYSVHPPAATLPTREHRPISDIIHPYPNVSAFLYNRFWKSGKTPNRAEYNKTVRAHPEYDDMASRLLESTYSSIERAIIDASDSPWGSNGWQNTTVVIEVPTGAKVAGKPLSISVPVPNVHIRSLVQIIRETVQGDPLSKEFHWHGFEETWQPPYPGYPSERVWGEVFTSESFLEMEWVLLSVQPNQEGDLPRAILACMFWSDATHCAQFGPAKVWPIYLYFGNQSKYARCMSSLRPAHHVAFLPLLSGAFEDELRRNGINPTAALLAHCKRELFHAVVRLVLKDPEFVKAYVHGLAMECPDDLRRLLYPRIFSWSADYPEKYPNILTIASLGSLTSENRVLLATVRDMGDCPCPRCKVKKADLANVGSASDMRTRFVNVRRDDKNFRDVVAAARAAIYKKGFVVNSKVGAVGKLKNESLVPTMNAFSDFNQTIEEKRFRFDHFLMLVVDIMHEFELGVWKALLLHLLRILNSLGASKVQEFNERFRQINTFGASTIRKFSGNVSELKKLAARDFEDILQASTSKPVVLSGIVANGPRFARRRYMAVEVG
ncbi:hypothetical protein K488DRAFT_91799 [Vararia minispora EC-137]|uniref:Uncharacterized protein n=1 Tax=Vararia minispora EC-137 TaxID=1314806 RepID=A0ACB8Q516_9AGAM|nr:hypothetical protein K488DRAFT_91799 [Vararia minispora EC-137]